MTPAELITELQQPWQHGEHFDARGAVFDAPVVLDGMTLRGFDLSGAHFKSGLSARRARFMGLTWISNARINGKCDLTAAQFTIDLRAEGLATEVLCLDHSQVRGVLDLERLRAQRVSLCNAVVLANLTLENAKIVDGIDMMNAVVMGGFWAKGAQLGQVQTEGAEIDGRINRPDV